MTPSEQTRLAEQLLEIAPRYKSKFAPDATEEEFTRETYKAYIREDERTTGEGK